MLYILLTWLLAPIWWPIALVRRVVTPNPRSILITEIAGIGDVVCSASLFQALRDQYPEATIDLLVDPIAKGLTPLLPMVNRVRLFAYPEQKGLKGRLKLARIVAAYDTTICLIPSAAQLTAFCWGAAPRRLTVLPSNINTSYKCLAPWMTCVAAHINGDYFPNTQFELCSDLLPLTTVPVKELQTVVAATNALQLDSEKTWVGLLISSGRALKRLSETQLVDVIQGLTQNLANKTGVVLLGGPGDVAQSKEVLALLASHGDTESVINTVGQYDLAQLPDLLKQLRLLIGVDSGVTHMADALGISILCIAGPVDLREVYLPNGRLQMLCAEELDCYPCSTVFNTPVSCRRGDRACLQTLPINRLFTAVSNLLAKNHAL